MEDIDSELLDTFVQDINQDHIRYPGYFIRTYPFIVFREIYNGGTPIQLAIEYGSPSVLKLFFDLGYAFLDDNHYESYISLAKKTLEDVKTLRMNTKAAEKVIDIIKDNKSTNDRMNSLFLNLIKNSDLNVIKEFFQQYPIRLYSQSFEIKDFNITQVSHFKYLTPLGVAVVSIKYDIVKLIIEELNYHLDYFETYHLDHAIIDKLVEKGLSDDKLVEVNKIRKLLGFDVPGKEIKKEKIEVVTVSYSDMPNAYDVVEIEDIQVW